MNTHLQLYDVGNQLWFGDGWVDYVVRMYVSVCVCVCVCKYVCMRERVSVARVHVHVVSERYILERIRFM